MRPFIVLAAFLALPLLASDTYQIDPAHSEVSFRVQHLGFVQGLRPLRELQGTILLDAQDPSRSKVDVSIEAYSINTENETRDKHLRSADFFDVARFPTVTFHSVSVKPTGKDHFDVTGDFTLHGVTRRITLPMAATGTATTPKETRAGFEGAITLNRSDYGMAYMPGIVGDSVAITLGVEAVKTDAKP